jgi:beta-lactamase class A
MPTRFSVLAFAAGMLLCNITLAQTSSPETQKTPPAASPLQAELNAIAEAHEGDMGIYCRNLESGEVYAVNADEPFETASTIKTAVMCAAMDLLDKGTGPYKTYYDKMTYETSATSGGSGIIQNYKPKTKLELKELIHLMMTVSDNTGTNMLCEWIGLDTVNQWLKDKGFEQTRIFSTIGGKVVWDQENREKWGLGRTTPREMGELMALIAEGKAGSPASTEEMLRVLSHQYFDSHIPGGLPPTTWVGNKTGSVNRSRSDCAIINGPRGLYVLTVFTKNNKDTSWGSSNKAQLAIRKISNVIWNHYSPEKPYHPPAGIDKF